MIDDKINAMSTQLVHRLREEIISGALKSGSKINLATAREHFGVSLSPLREALARLVPDGLAEFEDNRGYRVAPVSLENLAEVTQLRTEFECSALRHAMTAGDVDWEADVMRDLYRLSRIARDPAHPETLAHWEAAHAEFHMTLIAGCNMPLLQNTCSHGDAGLRRRARRQMPERLRRQSRSWPEGRELRRPLRACRRLRHGRRPRVHGLARGRELPGRGSRGRGRGPAHGGALVDAIHLSRTGGSPADLAGVPPQYIRSAQLCDAPSRRPATNEAIIQEARSGRLPPGNGELPLRELLAAMPQDTAIGVEVPMDGSIPAEMHAQRIFDATRQLFDQCRQLQPQT